MVNLIRGPELKLRRANDHLSLIKKEESNHIRSLNFIIEYDTKYVPNHKLVKVVSDSPVPDIIHVIVGEFIYQLRSSLDQIAVACARKSGVEGKDIRKISYPSGEDWEKFKSVCNGNNFGDITRLDSILRDEIIKSAPYGGGNEDLYSVFAIANIDKHLKLIDMASAGNVVGISKFNIKGGYTGLIIGDPENLSKGLTISDLLPDGEFIAKSADAKIEVASRICLGGDTIYEGRPLIEFLNKMMAEVARVYDRFYAILN